MDSRHPPLVSASLAVLLALAWGSTSGCPGAPPAADDDDVGDDDTTEEQDGGPALSVWPEAIEFGVVALGADEVRTLTLENVGDESLLIVTVSMVGGYELWDVEAFDGQRLEPGEYVDLLVLFHATVEGDASNTVRVLSNDPERPEVLVPVTATALPTP